jgi:hypothetical protein
MSDITLAPATETVEGAPTSNERPVWRPGVHETIKQAAARTGASYWVLYRLGRAGALAPAIRLGNSDFFCSRVIDELVAAYRARAAERAKA